MLRNIVSQRFGIPFTLKAPDSRSIRRSRLRTAMAVSVKARGKVLFERRSSQRLQLQGLDPESAAVLRIRAARKPGAIRATLVTGEWRLLRG
jgi:hypothetical protein